MKRILLSVFAAAVTVAWTVPASADVTFNGEYRARGEWRENLDFDDDTTDTQSFIGQRVRLTANAQATDDVSFKITLQDTRNWGAAPNTIGGGPNLTDSGDNHLDLHESYINISNFFDTPVSLRIGRQELSYGDQRLIGSFNWSNNGRSFDAVKAMVTTDLANIDIFASKIEDKNITAGNSDNDQDFYGIYATTNVVPNHTLDLYALLLRDGNYTGLPVTANIYTVGARLAGSVAGLDFTVELPYQFGDFDGTGVDTDIKAWAFAAKAGYTVPGAPMNLRLGAEYNYATGTEDGEDDAETFFNLFPTNHDKMGFMDLQAWRNVNAWSLNVSADVTEKIRVHVAYWDISRAEGDDDWYQAGHWNLGGSGLTANDDKEIGSELDLVASYKYNNNVTIEAGLSRFFAGDALDPDDDQDWAYLQVTGRF